MASLDRKIGSAADLQAVVRAMKALAASNIGQYEKAMLALADYYRTVQLGLGACLRQSEAPASGAPERAGVTGAVLFGSDQGLVGQFNEALAAHALAALAAWPGPTRLWVVGERLHARLAEAGVEGMSLFAVPNSANAIAPLIGQIQVETEQYLSKAGQGRILVFHHRPLGAGYEPLSLRLLPLDAQWRRDLVALRWPGPNLPEVMHGGATLAALTREYLFISLFRACAASLAAENASRLAAMERADRNIDELLVDLHGAFHRLRQGAIDEELFDVIAGYESLSA